MNQYLVFAGYRYYPNGGVHDFFDSFASLEEAIKYAKERASEDLYRWAHVADLNTFAVVFEC